MDNYAEEIAYWYYRLNHFFLVTNFVMHQAVETERGRASTEVDILGIKPKYATESIPTYPDYHLKPDPQLLSLLELTSDEFDESFIYVMAEVTSGGGEQRGKFVPSKVEYNLKRLGLYGTLDANEIRNTPMRKLNDSVIVCKIFSDIERVPPHAESGYFVIPLKHADEFVECRMSKDFKGRDWYLFKSNYIQSKIMLRP